MKTKNIKYFILALVLVGLVIFFPRCRITDPRDDFKLIFNMEPITTVISGTIVNAKSSEPIKKSSLTLTINGRDNDKVVDLLGKPKTTFDLTDGIVSMALLESANPTPENPVKLLFVVNAEGYLTTSHPIEIHQTGSKIFKIHMIEIDNPPEGVAVANGIGETDNNGKVINNDIEINLTEPITGAKSSFYLPKGIILKDKNGSPLKGKLNILLVYNNNQTEASLNSFPGGFVVTVENNGVQEEGVFISAGLATIEITDESGKKVKTFSPSNSLMKSLNRLSSSVAQSDTLPTVTVGVPQDSYNPETDALVQTGDEIDIWLYDTEAGIWAHETRDSIKGPDESGNYSVSFVVDHLSPCNPDWWNPGCLVHRYIRISGNDAKLPLQIRIRFLQGGGYIWNTWNVIDGVWIITRITPNTPVRIEAYLDCAENQVLVGFVDLTSLCGTAEIVLPVEIPDIVTDEKEIRLSGYCECDSAIILRPSGFPIWYKSTRCGAGSWIYAGQVENGKITIPGLEIGITYIFGTWYEGRWYQLAATIYDDYSIYVPGLSTEEYIKDVNVSGDVISYTIEFPDEVCKDFCKNP